VVLEVQYPSKSYIISNIHRSPNPPPNMSIPDHLENFLETLDSHLSKLTDLNCSSYVFLDANINLLKLNENSLSSDYMDTILTNGFIQLVSKATRIQNNKSSLIDHILSNSNLPTYNVGTIIDDLSDHFMNFIQINQCKIRKREEKGGLRCMINDFNINNFRDSLRLTDWTTVLSDNNVNSSFNNFWDIFKALYDTHLPIKRIKFNINKHKKDGYMTAELLHSRKTKFSLHKLALKSKTQDDWNRYTEYRN